MTRSTRPSSLSRTEFWAGVRSVMAEVEAWPEWKKMSSKERFMQNSKVETTLWSIIRRYGYQQHPGLGTGISSMGEDGLKEAFECLGLPDPCPYEHFNSERPDSVPAIEFDKWDTLEYLDE